MVNMQ